ncbi:MAG: methyltransferase type 11 [Candidatus Komeilibacteria bacterium RIFCSPLOWO2_02_FULL_48_11]|uniref:Methyltransferase type 11 n=1 Tax=Candidatus Komeilibacteria bacterium RIFCSPLOWO2_02_FULL_48_11 TaxID=1798553 RepID=A0A1G2BS63_9BACT|nr:MAG: methyltransferase type 11 [Candidatus Komeilibacteria bacterium RIFCSPLOWO2_02_FULL_48_11]
MSVPNTKQQNFWKSDFGQAYTERSIYAPESLDKFYQATYNTTRSEMNSYFLKDLVIASILEVGCNVGNQLRLLQQQGYSNLTGIEIQSHAVKRARELTKGINIIEGSAFALPFKDSSFDLVFTTGVLIHISPNDIKAALAEIYRVSKKYIWGFEYFSDQYQSIEYRGHKDRLWKADFSKIYLDAFPDLRMMKREKYLYTKNRNIDEMFLLAKQP